MKRLIRPNIKFLFFVKKKKNEIHPLNFGDNESYYVLFPCRGKVPPHFLIQIFSKNLDKKALFKKRLECQI